MKTRKIEGDYKGERERQRDRERERERDKVKLVDLFYK